MLLFLSLTAIALLAPGVESKGHHFDYLVFAQSWPASTCIVWEERGPNNHCKSPSTADWTIHGIWPSRSNSTDFPAYCNGSMKFDVDKIRALLPEMEQRWADVHAGEKDKYGFWRHEYEKHGTCASQLESMRTEKQYFKEGLRMNERFNIRKYLNDAGITPGRHFSVKQYADALKTALGPVYPIIKCAYNRDTKGHVIDEIHVCLNKELAIIDCESVSEKTAFDCPDLTSEDVLYPVLSPPVGPTFPFFSVVVGILLIATILVIIGYIFWNKYRHSSQQFGYEQL